LAPYPSSASRAYEAYYNFLGNYPNQAETGWRVDAQGLTHDQDNWFIKIKGAPYPERPDFAKRVEVVAHVGNAIIGK
jgi:hypothetical protein